MRKWLLSSWDDTIIYVQNSKESFETNKVYSM